MVAIRSRRSSSKGYASSSVSLVNILILHMVIIGSLVLIVPTQKALEPEIVSTGSKMTQSNGRVAPKTAARVPEKETRKYAPLGPIPGRNSSTQYLTDDDVPKEVQVLSWTPRIFLFKNLFTPAEAQYLIDHHENTRWMSHGDGGKSHRSSTGTFLYRRMDIRTTIMEQKVANFSRLGEENAEDMQVLRYELTEEYRDHPDYLSLRKSSKEWELDGGNRVATVLIYIGLPEEGGETVFPKVPKPDWQKDMEWSPCAQRGLAVKPYIGDAVLFYSVRPDNTFDPLSMHASCPVTKGVKWTATKWIHEGPFRTKGSFLDKTNPVFNQPCRDVSDFKECQIAAVNGGCVNEPFKYTGLGGGSATCLASCAAVDAGPCALKEAGLV